MQNGCMDSKHLEFRKIFFILSKAITSGIIARPMFLFGELRAKVEY